jgi:excisionase family DNA binding protein
MQERRRIGLMEAAERLGVSPMTIRRLVREGELQVYPNPLDRRQKLVDVADVERLRQAAGESQTSKRAA